MWTHQTLKPLKHGVCKKSKQHQATLDSINISPPAWHMEG